MKKQPKQLIILLAIMIILVAGFFGVRQYNKVQDSKGLDVVETSIVAIPAEDIIKISYDYEGETYTVEKEEDAWYDAADHTKNLTQYRINNIADALASLSATQVIESVTDMSQYGLAEGYRTISFETAGESYIFYLGEQNTITQDYYICKPSEGKVYAVEAGFANKFNFSLEDIVEEAEESTQETSAEEMSSEEIGSEEMGSEEMGSEEMDSEEIGSEEISSEEVSSQDIS